MRPNGELPSDRHADRRRQTPEFEKRSPSRCSSSLRVLRRQGAATQPATLRRQAAKLRSRFGPLTPSARSGNWIAGDGMKNGLSRSEQRTVSKPNNNRLTGKAPYKSAAENSSLQINRVLSRRTLS